MALDAKRALRDAAAETRNASATAYHAANPHDRATRAALKEAAIAATNEHTTASRAYTEALRVYETTPVGMSALKTAVERLAVGPDTYAHSEAQRALALARATRRAQVADLAMSRRHESRLGMPTPDELAALDQADARILTSQAAVDAAAHPYQEAHTTSAGLAEVTAAAQQAHTRATLLRRDALTKAAEARDAAAAEATRLYMDAGVSRRYAAFYAADMAEAASRTYPARQVSADGGPLRALTMKVKRDGPDHTKTLAAKHAAETDEAFLAANTALTDAIATAAATKATLDALDTGATTPAWETQQAALSATATARYVLEDAQTAHATALADRERLRARIGSGLGVTEPTRLPMRRAGNEIVRNPDGTTNAYIYAEPSDGFPHGRYIPAVGVAEVRGMGRANALVLENGEQAWLHGHYSRTTRGAGETQRGHEHVYVTDPQPDATPLRAEGVPAAGFYTYVDSSD